MPHRRESVTFNGAPVLENLSNYNGDDGCASPLDRGAPAEESSDTLIETMEQLKLRAWMQQHI